MDDRRTSTWVTVVDGRPTARRLRRCALRVIAGPDAGKQAEFAAETIRVGASAPADFVLSDRRVSGVHFEIRLEDGGYRLVDLGSTNGTRVGGLRLLDGYIEPGSEIAVGETRLAFEPLAEAVDVPLAAEDRLGGLVGRTPVMRQLFAQIRRVAATDATVLVSGETGTGKELVAEAVHELSARAGGPLVIVDCGALAANLVESELFGHEKGAFTGAMAAHAGAFERARGGTLFLDEVGELSVDLQPKLLGALERREVRRIGGARPIAVDIRIVAATNRDLAVEVSRGRFREDLYYRLCVAMVRVPPLRDRRPDIPLLVEHFLAELEGGPSVRIRSDTIEQLMKHDWPGNVRELRNVIERAALLQETPRRLGTTPITGQGPRLEVTIDTRVPFKQAKQELVAAFERRYAELIFEQHGRNISAAARACGMDRMSFHRILERVGLKSG